MHDTPSEPEPLLARLRPSYERNHWADAVEPGLSRELEALSEADWQALAEALPTEPETTGANLAKALRYTVTDRSTALLTALLRSGSPSVGLAAAQALFDRHQLWLPDISIRAELQRHAAAAADPETRQRLEGLVPKALC
jgi:hypothetical protein